jgi:hypothetical protein
MTIRRPARILRAPPCAPWLWALLNDEPCPPDASRLGRIDYECPPRDAVRLGWLAHRAQILEEWAIKRPGELPSCTRFDPQPEKKPWPKT